VDIADKPLRKDAERNRRRILDAAGELFAERGLGVSLNDIAHHAGLGVGTVYRRFPDKQTLIEELFELRVSELVALARAGAEDPDPWHGLTTFLERALALQADDRGFKEVVLGSPGGLEKVGRVRAQMRPVANELVRRARETGRLRSDLQAEDLPLIQLMVSAVIDTARDIDPELWRRYLQIVIDGLRADRPASAPLEPSALNADQVQQVMSSWQPPRR